MASKRDLKKDVDQLIYEVVSECYSYVDFYPEGDHNKAYEIADKAMELREEIIAQINYKDKSISSKEIKEHFNEVKKSFIEKVEALFKEVDVLFEEQEKAEKKEA
jgi:hypothetical protein